MTDLEFQNKTKALIDSLKSISANYGLGNDASEFTIITQVFLYKFINDKFAYELKKIDSNLAKANSWGKELCKYSEDDYEMLLLQLSADTAKLKPEHFISTLFSRQNESDFAKLFDDTLMDIAFTNNDIFSVKTDGGAKVRLFERITEFIKDESKRDAFAKAIVNKIVSVNFEHIFTQKYDFYATIFEYLIKDYNSNSGGKYAEYFTPHAVAKIMASIMVNKPVHNVTVYDPSAGSGTLLMNIAHAIGEDKCTIYSQDISQKSSGLLRLNLILNGLVHSISNIIQGNTILHPYHRNKKGELEKFDYIVSNPPFKLDFSDFRDDLDSKENHERFFAGIPKTPAKAKDKMAIYALFLQHIIYSLSKNGKAAIVVPTGFITAQSGIDKKIRKKLIDSKMLAGVISMPSNIFANTPTNVSIVFIDKNNHEDVVLIDASSLGKTVKDGKNQKTELTPEEEQYIINSFLNKSAINEFAVVAKYNELKEKNYSLSAGQYFDIKIEYSDISQQEYLDKMKSFQDNLNALFNESKVLENKIQNNLKGLRYE
ncbi:MAG: type I restriction-modification system subunit M [Marinifilaceae bacterium]|jgi:type I restriction enzyme M protein|nr:type I restriction-modification system subunit M [Marinifilaceae bacterium]